MTNEILHDKNYKKILLAVVVVILGCGVALVGLAIYSVIKFIPTAFNTANQAINQGQGVITVVTDTISNAVSSSIPQINALAEKQKQLDDTVNSAKQLLNIGGGN